MQDTQFYNQIMDAVGGGGSGSGFLVTMEITEPETDHYIYTADKTYGEIISAVGSGLTPVFIASHHGGHETVPCPGYTWTSNMYRFRLSIAYPESATLTFTGTSESAYPTASYMIGS